MHEIHNLSANAMIASDAYRRAVAGRAPRVRWWRRSELRTRPAQVTN